MEITNINQLDLNKVYSYADYLLWKFEERVELLKGKIFKMSPAPSSRHQKISGNLHILLHNHFLKNCCNIYYAPFDVRLPAKNEKGDAIHTVVQPDLCIICDENKIDERGCIGAPDLIIEILSPGNSKKELKNKFELYEEAGVKEYWIVRPTEDSVTLFVLENEKYVPKIAIVDDFVNSYIFPSLKIHTDEIFR